MSDSDTTGAFYPDQPDKPPPLDEPGVLPSQIGRYRIERILGQGGFELVYLASDEQLQRLVALKVPHAKHTLCGADAEFYLAEARTVANLDHPNIVPVYDVGATGEHPVFIVSKFIEGCTLSEQIKVDRPTLLRSAELVATIAEALHHAHQTGLVHRDIKPSNILLDKGGKPFVVDFGLALKEEDIGTGPRYAGTGPYMSPEQARGEGHRVDGRSDIFSLGIVLYELLTGRRPFKADAKRPAEQITEFEPRPPRQYDDRIPKELERICFRAMAKRASERYSTAKDLADDLRHFLAVDSASHLSTVIGPASGAPAPSTMAATAPPSGTSAHGSVTSQGSLSTGPPLRIVPKGLRSFDAHDADFFLELIPGPRDRDGLPDIIRFWKSRIEAVDADRTFTVGLIYGPSGCGKSSLVKAGLLPRLGDHVSVVYVEATADETEMRLLQGLRNRCPALPSKFDLKQSLAALRRGQGIPAGKKLLIVLDQFEQWLHARRDQPDTALVQALRQCDGGRVQAVLMVRDDFWMGATRFLRQLEVRIVEGQNSAAVDLFPIRHAEKVLAAFGHAFGILPESLSRLEPDQKQFLQQAVQSLAEEGKVICVRLALFAEMMKARPWTPASLAEVGGAQGVGETFLEETFSAATAPPLHRYHQQAARAVLRALLPEPGADIKGHLRTHAELLDASGYGQKPQEFDELIRILDSELLLITPGEGETEQKSYQLTHDYLVPSLRDWLTRKQKETQRGRAELALADRAAIWNARPENRQLPSLWQWASILFLTSKKNWTELQHKLMRQASRYHLVRLGVIAVILVLIGWAGFEGHGMLQARLLRDRLLDAPVSETPRIVDEMAAYRRWADPVLRQARTDAESNADAAKLLNLSLALLPSDAGQADYLYERMLTANLPQLLVIREALYPHRQELSERLWVLLEKPESDAGKRFRAACALARFDPSNTRWQKVAVDIAAVLALQDPFVIAGWTNALEPAAPFLSPPLAEFLEDEKRSIAERGLIAKIYGNYAARRPDALRHIENRLAETPDSNAGDEARAVFFKKQASCAAALLVIGDCGKAWPLLKHCSDPTLRTFVLERVAAAGVDPKMLLARLDMETDVSVQRAILLALGDYGIGRLPDAERRAMLPRIEQLYRDHPDAGVHGAADWLLRQWQAGDSLTRLDKELAGKIDAKRRWFINSQGLAMSVIDSAGEVWLREGEEKHRRRVLRRYAIASKEASVEQYLRFHKERKHDEKLAHSVHCPMSGVSWFEAAQYCNWLSARDKIPKDQWCYLPNKEGQYSDGMSLAPDWWKRTGYRLPTEAEWVHACRAGAECNYSFGHSVELIHAYAWNAGNSSGRTQPVGAKKPNDLGLFDMHGNVWEWTQDLIDPKKKLAIDPKRPLDDTDTPREVAFEQYRLQLGGSFGNQSIDVRPSFPSFNKTFQRHPAVGFRPARTMP
jgi:serine/threonine protein kinase/formylglycine-generating enzyme required for sulfatase activity